VPSVGRTRSNHQPKTGRVLPEGALSRPRPHRAACG